MGRISWREGVPGRQDFLVGRISWLEKSPGGGIYRGQTDKNLLFLNGRKILTKGRRGNFPLRLSQFTYQLFSVSDHVRY